MAYLNEVLALGLCDEWLELGSSEGVDKTSLRYDQKENLGAGQDREFISLKFQLLVPDIPNRNEAFPSTTRRKDAYLLHNTGLALRESNMATRLILNELDLNLATLATRLVIIIILIVGAHAVSLGAPAIVTGEVIMTRRKLLINLSRHNGKRNQ
jgi:hypothetical protein